MATRIFARAGVPRRARGTALVLFTTLMLLVSAAVLLKSLGRGTTRDADAPVVAGRLAEARAGLLGWSVAGFSASGQSGTPGLLPFPDRRRDGNYDGRGDCVTFGLRAGHLLGRLPWAGDVSPCPSIALYPDIHDGPGGELWYAVSGNLVTRGGRVPVNSDMLGNESLRHGWITLRDAGGRVVADPATGGPLPIAAVIMAPGVALANQDRGASAPSPENYLDSVRIGTVAYSNADADGCPDSMTAPCGGASGGEEFVRYRRSSEFNDRLAYVTVDGLMRAVEKRVLGEAATALNMYRAAHGAYPWPVRFREPRTESTGIPIDERPSTRRGLLPVHLPDELFATRLVVGWNLADATPTSASSHFGDAALVPPMGDVLDGAIAVAVRDGRCLWSDPARAECTGSVAAAHIRADLGISVTRTVEVTFDFVDATPEVMPPAATDVRRRTLSTSGDPLMAIRPARFSDGSWNIRITDSNGTNWGRRELMVDPDTRGSVTVGGIRFAIAIVYDGVDDKKDELPQWFTENHWHRLVFVAMSRDVVAGGDGDCTTPTNSCLTLTVDGSAVRNDIEALLMAPGSQLPGQNRGSGDCDGDGMPDDALCAYFESDNGNRSTPVLSDTFARNQLSAAFNDQVLVLAPPPR